MYWSWASDCVFALELPILMRTFAAAMPIFTPRYSLNKDLSGRGAGTAWYLAADGAGANRVAKTNANATTAVVRVVRYILIFDHLRSKSRRDKPNRHRALGAGILHKPNARLRRFISQAGTSARDF